MRRPRVTLVAHDIHMNGGMERACAELIRAGVGEVEFTVVSNTLEEDLRQDVRWLRVPLVRRPFPIKFLLFFLGAAIRVRQAQSDLIHTVGAIIPNRVTIATVQFCHAGFRERTGYLAPRGGSLVGRANTMIVRLLSLVAECWCYRPARTRAFATVSDGVAQEVLRHYPGVPVAVTPNGVDTVRFSPAPAVRNVVRRAEGIGDAEFIAIFVGGDWDRKGLAIAIAGLAVAHRVTGRRLLLWIVGSGDERRFRAMAETAGVSENVRFFGARTDTERLYQSADVFVLPTLYETFSLAAYEAAACGLPIVATRVSGVEELIGNDDAGFIVERTPEAIGGALDRLATEPELRGRLGTAGRRRAESFTWHRSTSAVLELYRAFLKDDSAGAATRTTSSISAGSRPR
jgi:glycosyltransferase involved in cell wall biosynthesis